MQVRLHLSTLAGLEDLPQPSVSKADNHDAQCKAMSVTVSTIDLQSKPTGAANANRCHLEDRATGMGEVASPICASWNQLGQWLRTMDGLRRAA